MCRSKLLQDNMVPYESIVGRPRAGFPFFYIAKHACSYPLRVYIENYSGKKVILRYAKWCLKTLLNYTLISMNHVVSLRIAETFNIIDPDCFV